MDVRKLWDALSDFERGVLKQIICEEAAGPVDVTEAEAHALLYQGMIPAIRLFRDRTGLSLRQSKDTLERYLQSHPRCNAPRPETRARHL